MSRHRRPGETATTGSTSRGRSARTRRMPRRRIRRRAWHDTRAGGSNYPLEGLPNQPAHPQADRGILRLGEDCRPLSQDALARDRSDTLHGAVLRLFLRPLADGKNGHYRVRETTRNGVGGLKPPGLRMPGHPAGAKNAHQNTPTFVKKAVLRPCDRFLEPAGRRMSFFKRVKRKPASSSTSC